MLPPVNQGVANWLIATEQMRSNEPGSARRVRFVHQRLTPGPVNADAMRLKIGDRWPLKFGICFRHTFDVKLAMEAAMEQKQPTNVKSAARDAIESLPEDSTWDDAIYRLYVRQKIDAGLADVDAGRTVDTSELRRRLGLKP